MSAPIESRERVVELARLFLKLGVISVGGPAAHIALMRDEVVERRRWLTDQEFLDLVGATNLIPGPNSTELAIHIGRHRAGWRGLVVAGGCFILPAVIIVAALAAIYARIGSIPQTQALFYGIKPAVMAIVGVALWRLARTAMKSGWHAVLAAAALIGVAAGFDELLVLAAAGLIGGAAARWRNQPPGTPGVWLATKPFAGAAVATTGPAPAGPLATLGTIAAASAAVTYGKLFLVFLKAGAFLFGSGYVLLAFLRADLVDRLGWLSERQLLDAIAVGQVTPGPVFTTATFVGYLVGGPSGSAIATIGIFLPAFVYVALSAPVLPRLRRSKVAAGVLDGVNLASLALMAVVSAQLGRAALIDRTTASVAVVSLAILLAWRINTAWLIAAGAVVGLVAGF